MFAKKPTPSSRKSTRGAAALPLQLRTETLHVLRDSDLSLVVGGTGGSSRATTRN